MNKQASPIDELTIISQDIATFCAQESERVAKSVTTINAALAELAILLAGCNAVVDLSEEKKAQYTSLVTAVASELDVMRYFQRNPSHQSIDELVLAYTKPTS